MKAKSTIATDNTYEDWVNRKWRPAVAWSYIVICLFDFLVAPVMTFYFFQGYEGSTYTQWQPLTLVGSGLFHIAMGAIVGVTAWQRGEEKKTRYRNHDYEPEDYDRADHRDRLSSHSAREDR
jgi:hypothetical protein